MKRKYSKPEIIFEDFTLCQSIATGCSYSEGATPSLYEVGCGIDLSPKDEDDIVFTSEMACDFTYDDGKYNGICYHTFDGSNSVLFGS